MATLKWLIMGMVLIIPAVTAPAKVRSKNPGSYSSHVRIPARQGLFYYQERFATQQALDDLVIPTITVNTYGVTISFPVPVKFQLICRRTSDYYLSRILNGYTDEDRNIQLLKGELESGVWTLRLQYTAMNKNYLFETEVEMP